MLGTLFWGLFVSFGLDRRYVFEGSTTSDPSTEFQESNNEQRTQEEPDRDRHPPIRFCFPPDDLPTDLDSSLRLAIRFPPLHHSSRPPFIRNNPSCLSRLALALGPLARLLSSSSIRDVRCSSPFIEGDERDGGVVRQDPNLIRALIGTFVGLLSSTRDDRRGSSRRTGGHGKSRSSSDENVKNPDQTINPLDVKAKANKNV